MRTATPSIDRLATGALAALAVAALACGGTEEAAGPWPQWRGPEGLGYVAEEALPVRWNADGAGVTWSTEIPGSGISQPIVSGGRIFLTTSYPRGAEIERAAMALDFETGEYLWQAALVTTQPEKRHWLNTHATPTPVTDGTTLFIYTGSHLAALDFEGTLLWVREVNPDFVKLARYGSAASPVLFSDSVIIFHDDEWGNLGEPSWLAAFDKMSGEPRWKTEWDDTCCSYASPLLVERPGGVELVIATSPWVAGFDPATGEKLWSHEYTMIQMVPSPVVEGDVLAITGSIHSKKIVVLKLAGSGKKTRPELLWENVRGAPELASPLLIEGKLFVVNEKGIMSCFEVDTGKLLWQERLSPGVYRASLAGGGNKIYATNTGGVTSVVAARRKFKVLAENELGDGVTASPAIAGTSLLLRGDTRLYRIDRPAAADGGEEG